MAAASASAMIPWSRSMAACAFDAAMSSRHSRLSNVIEALMRVISSSGFVSNRPPQVRCAGLSSAMAGRCHARGEGSNNGAADALDAADGPRAGTRPVVSEQLFDQLLRCCVGQGLALIRPFLELDEAAGFRTRDIEQPEFRELADGALGIERPEGGLQHFHRQCVEAVR